ncbi:hypothetical protein [Streptomyces sioyaensis]|uniref:hypothetical protein n=1 Tax=Streptomyces sioyaensis TaxID=67364 RepID=UPI003D72D8AC
MAFGFGIHQCLGQPLARVEPQVVRATLFDRIPTLQRAADRDALPFKEYGVGYGIHECPSLGDGTRTALTPSNPTWRIRAIR